jgi:hypothetical protein
LQKVAGGDDGGAAKPRPEANTIMTAREQRVLSTMRRARTVNAAEITEVDSMKSVLGIFCIGLMEAVEMNLILKVNWELQS